MWSEGITAKQLQHALKIIFSALPAVPSLYKEFLAYSFETENAATEAINCLHNTLRIAGPGQAYILFYQPERARIF
jgi:hypothetical protein